jgi:hypothetical protein
MLWALLIGLWLSGGSDGGLWFFDGQTVKQLQKQIAQVQPDKASRKAVERTLERISGESGRWQSVRAEFSEDLFATLARHDASSADFQALAFRADAINAASGKALLELRFELRRELSDSQWDALFKTKGR